MTELPSFSTLAFTVLTLTAPADDVMPVKASGASADKARARLMLVCKGGLRWSKDGRHGEIAVSTVPRAGGW